MPLDFNIPLRGQGSQIDAIGQISRMSDLHSQRQDAEMRQRQIAQLKKKDDEDSAFQRVLVESNGDGRVASKRLKEMGLYDRADALDNSLREQRTAAFRETTEQLRATDAVMKRVQDLVGSVKAPEAWTPVRQSITKLITDSGLPQEYLAHIPEQYDPAALEAIGNYGKSASEIAATRIQSLEDLEKLEELKAKGFTRMQGEKNAIEGYLSTVDTPEEFRQTIDQARSMGASQASLVPFIERGFSPELIAELKENVALRKKGSAGKLGEYEDMVARYAKSKGIDPEDVSFDEAMRLRRDLADANKGTPRPTGGGGEETEWEKYYRKVRGKTPDSEVTPQQYLSWKREFNTSGLSETARANALRWKADKKLEIEAAGYDPEQKKSLLDEIEKTYREMSGDGPPAPPPGAPQGPNPFARPAGAGRMSDFFMGSAPRGAQPPSGPLSGSPSPFAPPPRGGGPPPAGPPQQVPTVTQRKLNPGEPGPPPGHVIGGQQQSPGAPPQAAPPPPELPPQVVANLERMQIPEGQQAMRVTLRNGMVVEIDKSRSIRVISQPGRR